MYSDQYPRGRVIKPDDHPKMVNAIIRLVEEKVHFARTSSTQLKIGKINFYPTTGKITIDGGGRALPNQGLDALLTLLRPDPKQGSVQTKCSSTPSSSSP